MKSMNFILNKLKKTLLINYLKPVHLLILTVSLNRIRDLINSKINMISMKIYKSIPLKMISIMKLFQIRPSEKIKVRPSKKTWPKNINIKNQYQISTKILIVSSIDYFQIAWFSKKSMIKIRWSVLMIKSTFKISVILKIIKLWKN